MYFLSIIKELFGGLKKKQKVIVLVLIIVVSYLFEITYKLLDDRLVLIENNNNEVVSYGKRIDSLENRVLAIENRNDQIVLRTSFNAYIERIDSEYHAQTLFNDTIAQSNAELAGKVDMLEKLAILNEGEK